MSSDEPLKRAEALLARLNGVRAKLDQAKDPDEVKALLEELNETSKEVEAELIRAKREADAAD